MTVPPSQDHKKGCCSCPGPQGPQGVQGVQGQQGAQGVPGKDGAQGQAGPSGLQGSQGPAGLQGLQGPAGAQGPQGVQGIDGQQGPQGLQGVPGKDCDRDCECEHVYCSLYSQQDQTLVANGTGVDYAKFEGVGVVSSPLDFDVSLAASLGQIKFLKSGVYTVAWDADGQLSPPFPTPVPSWALGFWLNGAFVPGSGIAGFSQSPDDDANCLTSVQNITVAAGDVIMLRNAGKASIFLKSNHPELIVPMTSASFSAIKIG